MKNVAQNGISLEQLSHLWSSPSLLGYCPINHVLPLLPGARDRCRTPAWIASHGREKHTKFTHILATLRHLSIYPSTVPCPSRPCPLNQDSSHLGRGIDAELQLGSLPIIHGETLHEQGGESGPRPAAERVEDQEALRGKLINKSALKKLEFHPTCFMDEMQPSG